MGPLIGGAMQPVLDLALIATMVVFLIAVIKPLIALKLDPATTAYDSAVQLLALTSAAGLIVLASYQPQAFSILSESVAVSAAAFGGVRVIKGATPALTTVTSELAAAEVDPAAVAATPQA